MWDVKEAPSHWRRRIPPGLTAQVLKTLQSEAGLEAEITAPDGHISPVYVRNERWVCPQSF